MAQTDWASQLASYTGVLTLPAVTDSYIGTSYSSISIPLFIKDHPIPVRLPKITEINSGPQLDMTSGLSLDLHMLFWGARDPISLALNGWIITPISGGTFAPTYNGSATGTAIPGLTGVSYGEIISAYIEGRMSRNASGGWVRQDPESYTDPYGHQYSYPLISDWDCSFTQPRKKQTFSMTLYIESGALSEIG